MQGDTLIAGHVDEAPVIQRRVQNRHGVALGHVDLIENAETAVLGAAVHRPPAELHLVVLEGVRADEGGAVGIHVKGHIVNGPAEEPGQIFRQDILAGGLIAHQKEVLSVQKGHHRHLQDLLADEIGGGAGHAVLNRFLYGPGIPEFFKLLQDIAVHKDTS